MGKLLRNILLFGLPFGVLLAWMWLHEPDPAYKYLMVQKDCRTGNWIYRRVHKEKAPIDVAFIGTSKTMCNVNDALLEEKVRAATGSQIHIANLGVCRIGENMHYLIARDLFAHKQPKVLVVEVSTDMPYNSHFEFPYMAETHDLLAAPIIADGDFLSDFVEFNWNRLVYHREDFLGIERSFEDILSDSLHSFLTVPTDGIADSLSMATTKAKRQLRLTNALPQGFDGWWNQLNSRHPKHYFSLIKGLCEANNCKMVFLYLPVYGASATQPQQTPFLESLAPVLIPPDSIFSNPKFYFDDSHLNMSGALRLTDWLSSQVTSITPR